MTTDQLRLPRPRLPAQFDELGSRVALVGALATAAVLGAVAVTQPHLWHVLLAAAITINLIIVAMKWPQAAAIATLMWLPFVAFVRRLLIDETGWIKNDPLLLVAPIVALFLLYRLFVIERRRLAPDIVSKLVLALLVLVVFGAFNPVGRGGVAGGLGGVIFLGVPLIWFFIGRDLANRRMAMGVVYAVIAAAVVIGCYGLYQTEFGSMPQWDLDWYNVAGFDGVTTGASETGKTQFRPWGTFPSTSEYSGYLGIALALSFAMLFHRRVALAAAIPILGLAVFLAGGRSMVALLGIAVIVMAALRTRNKVLALGVVVVGVAIVYGAALAFGPRLDRAASLSSSANTKRQVGGLLNPLDPQRSTFLSHWDSLANGVKEGFTNPAGLGTGATNIGGSVGGSEQIETDFDVADVFVSLGFLGGLTFVAIILISFATIFYRYLSGRPDRLLLAAVGVLVVTFGQWLNGGHYAASALSWFFLGWAMRPERTRMGRMGAAESALARFRRSRERRVPQPMARSSSRHGSGSGRRRRRTSSSSGQRSRGPRR